MTRKIRKYEKEFLYIFFTYILPAVSLVAILTFYIYFFINHIIPWSILPVVLVYLFGVVLYHYLKKDLTLELFIEYTIIFSILLFVIYSII